MPGNGREAEGSVASRSRNSASLPTMETAETKQNKCGPTIRLLSRKRSRCDETIEPTSGMRGSSRRTGAVSTSREKENERTANKQACKSRFPSDLQNIPRNMLTRIQGVRGGSRPGPARGSVVSSDATRRGGCSAPAPTPPQQGRGRLTRSSTAPECRREVGTESRPPDERSELASARKQGLLRRAVSAADAWLRKQFG